MNWIDAKPDWLPNRMCQIRVDHSPESVPALASFGPAINKSEGQRAEGHGRVEPWLQIVCAPLVGTHIIYATCMWTDAFWLFGGACIREMNFVTSGPLALKSDGNNAIGWDGKNILRKKRRRSWKRCSGACFYKNEDGKQTRLHMHFFFTIVFGFASFFCGGLNCISKKNIWVWYFLLYELKI